MKTSVILAITLPLLGLVLVLAGMIISSNVSAQEPPDEFRHDVAHFDCLAVPVEEGEALTQSHTHSLKVRHVSVSHPDLNTHVDDDCAKTESNFRKAGFKRVHSDSENHPTDGVRHSVHMER